MFIPPLAFVAWTMAESGSLFGVLVPGWGLVPRVVGAVLLGLVLTVVARVVVYRSP